MAAPKFATEPTRSSPDCKQANICVGRNLWRRSAAKGHLPFDDEYCKYSGFPPGIMTHSVSISSNSDDNRGHVGKPQHSSPESYITAERFIRKMRGRTQSCLFSSKDDYWVVKFNIPAQRRLLINEWITTTLLHHVGVCTPQAGIVCIPPQLPSVSDVALPDLDSRSPESLLHFGSLFPGSPDRTAVYDFLPDSLLGGVLNSADFVGALAMDLWMGFAGPRQCIFFRESEVIQRRDDNKSATYIASMIDHGGAFNGQHWTLSSEGNPSYSRPCVYDMVRGWGELERWLEAIRSVPADFLQQVVKTVPSAWKNGGEGDLNRILEQLVLRRNTIPDLVLSYSRRRSLFPNWTSVICPGGPTQFAGNIA
jgi:hypothetical protein